MNPKNNSIVTKLQADIVVIGGGGAGLSAAVAAAEQGIRNIIILEKRAVLGGNSVFPGGILGLKTTEKSLGTPPGFDTGKDDIFRQAMEYAHWKTNGRLIRALINKSPDTIEWLQAKGVSLKEHKPLYYSKLPTVFLTSSGKESLGVTVIKNLTKICQESGISIMCQTPAKKILTDAKGNVVGVIATQGTKEIRIDAKSVIIATGGFAGNEALLKKYDPSLNVKELLYGGFPHTGDGTLMAEEIGAATEGMVLEKEGPSFPWSTRINILARKPNTIWVNKNGERFTSEHTLSMAEATNAIYHQPEKVSFSLFDERLKKAIIEKELTSPEVERLGSKSLQPELDNDFQTQSKEGRVKISNSWDEMADWMGATPEVLRATIEEYNSFCNRRYDETFIKEQEYLTPINTPPYYAVRCHLRLLVTHGGPVINHRTEVLNHQGKPIRGLYAAGDETGSAEANSYNIILTGHSFGFSISSGRISGEEASRYVTSNR